MKHFRIKGGRKLSGSVTIGGSKNAVLPIIAASLLTKEKTKLKNVPHIEDVLKICELLNHLGVHTVLENNTLEIDPTNFKNPGHITKHVGKMRASMILAGPLLARFGSVEMNHPGGCVLGKRPLDTHIRGFEAFGAVHEADDDKFKLTVNGELKAPNLTLSEASVTGTENLVILAVATPGTTTLKNCAMEPHVQDMCKFLNEMGADIQGIGQSVLTINGGKPLKGVEYSVVPDYLEAGTMLLAGAVTNSRIKVEKFNPADLDLFIHKMREVGVEIEVGEDWAEVIQANDLKAIRNVKTAIHPGFPTDLLAPFSILLTQAEGASQIYETLFEGRFSYLFELEKMGAQVYLQNPHQALMIGPCKLKGAPVASCDIRAGAAVVLAALAADGESLVTNINYIDRGYQALDEKLKALGADIERVESDII
jgi:UDP-N-acetylglucosamine 1-carboxyvinyltransferase